MGNLSTFDIYQAQYPNSELTEAEFDSLIPVVSQAIETYLDRELETQTYDEYHDGFYDSVVITREYPITKVYGVFPQAKRYGQIDIEDTTASVTLTFDTEAFTADYIVDMTTEYSYDYSGDSTASQALSGVSADMTSNGISNSYTVDDRYQSVSPKLFKSTMRTSGGDNNFFEVVGVDLDGGYDFIVQGERDIITQVRSSDRSDSIFIKYTAGYTLPVSTSNYGTLPRDIIDVTNRIIREISQYDGDETNNASVKSETLGNASYSLQGNGEARAYITGVLGLFADQLARYKRFDIGRF